PLAISDIVRANLSVDCGVKERHFAAITSVDVLIILGSVASTLASVSVLVQTAYANVRLIFGLTRSLD
ncbi:hypothetical protein, partial [Burkholderia reimsis]|uniref:hypothetical protein n=1 Tax=Burkholderia reimsis TaxID=2234132 RepID=UPI001AD81C8D